MIMMIIIIRDIYTYETHNNIRCLLSWDIYSFDTYNTIFYDVYYKTFIHITHRVISYIMFTIILDIYTYYTKNNSNIYYIIDNIHIVAQIRTIKIMFTHKRNSITKPCKRNVSFTGKLFTTVEPKYQIQWNVSLYLHGLSHLIIWLN